MNATHENEILAEKAIRRWKNDANLRTVFQNNLTRYWEYLEQSLRGEIPWKSTYQPL